MISLRNITRKYGDLVAVDGVTLDIARGQIVGLLGHNGAGKTTVMKMLTGFLEPTSGSITVDGMDVVSRRQAVQRKIGYMPENAPTYPEMLVQEYLATLAELRGVPADKIRCAVVDAARATSLTKRLVDPISTLSKGFRQRVGLAQAIIHQPEVLILDEPTNGLDPTQIQSIRELIRELGKSATILLSTHILQEVEAVCDSVVVLIDGRLASHAPLSELTGGAALRLAVAAGAADVAATVTAIDGIDAAEKMGPDPRLGDFEVWRLRCRDDEFPVQAIIDTAGQNGWTLGGIAPESKTLEVVFRELQNAHVAGREAAE